VGDTAPAVSWTSTANVRWDAVGVSGANAATPEDGCSAVSASTSTASVDPGTFTTTTNGDMLLWFGGWNAGTSMTTPPSGYTNDGSDISLGPATWFGHQTQAAAGAIGSQAGTLAASLSTVESIVVAARS
jgi:hypothetical protein